MRVMSAVAVLLSAIACISKAEAQACDRDCSRCLIYARGECIKRSVDPACEARKRKCLEQRIGAPKKGKTVAPRPIVRHHQQQIPAPQTPIADGVGQRQRDRRGRRVAELLDVDDDLFLRHAELFRS